MEVKETGYLKVLADLSFPENRIVINPNDGYDLGLMMTEAQALFFYGESPATLENPRMEAVTGTVEQKNECALGTVELSMKSVEKLGTPKRVRLHIVPGESPPKLLINAE
ncbi:MAG: hypothetical protein EA427_12115 [Spirochaetaceae bacterium]|nr:MAG: hypothetical protein EA427_12115 [Spirochaetaceae bacterium]